MAYVFRSSVCTVRRVFWVAVPFTLSLFLAEPSRACSIATSAEPRSIPGCVNSACEGEIPRNAVFFENSLTIDGNLTATTHVPGEAYFEPSALLEAGMSVTAGTSTATVGDFFDEDPPAAPALVSAAERRLGGGGCGASSSCDGVEYFELEVVLGEDSIASSAELTLLVYFGDSAADATDKSVPSLRLASAVTTGASSTFTIAGTASRWVAIETMDQAGNRSGRTPAVRISR